MLASLGGGGKGPLNTYPGPIPLPVGQQGPPGAIGPDGPVGEYVSCMHAATYELQLLLLLVLARAQKVILEILARKEMVEDL